MSDAHSLTLHVVSAAALLSGLGLWVARILSNVDSMVLQRVPVRVDRRRR